ncbi:hypothetical protein ACX801_05525 [Arthrobacter bambusae]
MSTQTIAINNPAHASSAAATENTAFGPFFLEDTPEISFGSATAGAPALTAATSTTKPGPGPASTSSSARGNPKLP